MRLLSYLTLLGIVLGTTGCGGTTPKPLTDADIQAQQEQEKRVKEEESAHRKRQPRPKTQEDLVEEGERRLRR
jgi:predicted small lipoprotein YifL